MCEDKWLLMVAGQTIVGSFEATSNTQTGFHVWGFARHKYGCRTLQRLLEKCSQQQTLPIVEGLLSEVVPLPPGVAFGWAAASRTTTRAKAVFLMQTYSVSRKLANGQPHDFVNAMSASQ